MVVAGRSCRKNRAVSGAHIEKGEREPAPVPDTADISATKIGARVLRTPRSAGIAGIAFSVLFTVVFVCARLVVPADPTDAGTWLTDPTKKNAARVGLALAPFAGIAFLWFIGVVRSRIGEAEDRFFATVFLGSGLLFIAPQAGSASAWRTSRSRSYVRSASASAAETQRASSTSWTKPRSPATTRRRQ